MKHVVLFCVVLAACVARAENWAQWRGPRFDGSSPETKLPDKLDDSTALWTCALPGPSSATPVVFEGRIFLNAMDVKTRKLLAICVGRADGKIAWQREVAEDHSSNSRSNFAAPSPATDGKRVFFLYGSGDLAAFDMEGKALWSRNLQKEFGTWNVQWLYGSSPLLFEGRLYVQVLHRDFPVGRRGGGAPAGNVKADSYLLAVNPEDGKDLFRVVRPSDAVSESREAYSTPTPWQRAGEAAQIVLAGGDAVTGHDAASGKELWRVGGWNPNKVGHWRLVPSVTIAGDVCIACPPKAEGRLFAIKGGGVGEVTGSHVAWRSETASSDVCVPLYYDGRVYNLDGDKRVLQRIDTKTGKMEWQVSLPGSAVYRASPTGADGKIYCVSEAGDVSIVGAGEAGKVIFKGKLATEAGAARSSVVVSGEAVFVRTGDALHGFGVKR